jgi:hypothetical protein
VYGTESTVISTVRGKVQYYSIEILCHYDYHPLILLVLKYILAVCIGYVVLADAVSTGLASMRLQNKAGITVAANGRSVAFAIMELDGTRDARGNADLMDASSAAAWPIAGYTYYILRKGVTLGVDGALEDKMSGGSKAVMFDCKTRRNTLAYLEWFYTSDSAEAIGDELGRV